MCGIVGYIGNHEATGILLAGLRELEYRGYDSAGMAVLETGGLRCFKAVGKLDNLAAKVDAYRSSGAVAAIGHTRWATHGKPTEANAHPHGLTHSQVVHNGIIENYQCLKASVSTRFLSQTDSEVIVHLFEKHLADQGNDPGAALAVFRASLDQLHGAYAILLVSELTPGRIFFARKGSPLQVGFTASGCYFASSDAPLLGVCDTALYFEDGQWGMATETDLLVFDAQGDPVEPVFSLLPVSSVAAQKEGFRYFMEKEIYEQPRVLGDILTGRLRDGAVELEEFPPDWLLPFRSITLCACGTSYHAALAGSYLLERLARVPVKVEIASEFRYCDPVLDPGGCS
jgi:glucosamine--fructose-6-phosphate aminotransferase (isomerizing)